MIAGLTPMRIRQLGILPEIKQKVGKHTFLYDRSQALDAWHKKRAERSEAETKITDACLQQAQESLFISFMKGDYDRKAVKERHQLKKLASRYTKPKTTTVQLTNAWDIPGKQPGRRSK